MKLLYCSFADDHGFLGVVLVKAKDAIDAHRRITEMGCNPGGEMAVVPFPRRAPLPTASWMNRLLSKQELDQLFGDMVKGAPPPQAEIICKDCNPKSKVH